MSSDAPTTCHVKNISSQTTENQVRDFFSFCGKISSLSITSEGETQSAAVTFEKPTAAKTALLLDNTQLGPNLVHVSSAATLEELSSPKAGDGAATTGQLPDSVDQEDKPRSRILAEYLAHGYTVSDRAIERAIALDNQHGMSSRFTQALKNFDSKYKATEKAQGIDKQYGVSEKAAAGWSSMNSYFEKAIGTPTGQKVRSFYADGSKQVLDVHTEARRLADMKSGKPTPEQAQMETVPGTSNTKCNCGGAAGSCPCAPGKCACAGCEHAGEKAGPDEKTAEKIAEATH